MLATAERLSVYYNVDNIYSHFEALEKQDKIPSFDNLVAAALDVCTRFATTRAFAMAKTSYAKQPKDIRVPLGKSVPESASAEGDEQLANTIIFNRDYLAYRQWNRGTSLGHIGSVWELLKVRIDENRDEADLCS